MTPSTRATISSGRWRLERDGDVQPPSISTHSRIEPSCEPHVAATRYCSGSCEFELVATLTTEKSLLTNDRARQPNANAMNRNCPRARARERHPRPRCRASRRERQRAEHDREQEREDQCELSELGITVAFLASRLHVLAALSIAAAGCALPSARGLGRHVVLVVLRQHLGCVEHAVGSDACLARRRLCPP
jgi:hypothetical protein